MGGVMALANKRFIGVCLEWLIDAFVVMRVKLGGQPLVGGPDFVCFAENAKKRTVPNWAKYCT